MEFEDFFNLTVLGEHKGFHMLKMKVVFVYCMLLVHVYLVRLWYLCICRNSSPGKA